MVDSSRDPAPAPTPARSRSTSSLTEWLVALSFANLVYLRTWEALLDSASNITATAYLVAIANVLLLSVVLWGAYVLVRRIDNVWVTRLAALVPAGLLLILVHAIANIYFSEVTSKRNMVYGAGLLVAAIVAVSHRVRVAGWHVLRVFAPAAAITFGQSLWGAATYDEARWQERLPAASADAATTPRVLWLIFDEWDYGLTFDPRPEWLRTPELDRLNATSFHASQAVSPGPETDIAIPRLLTGNMAAKRNELRTAQTIFTKAKAAGLSTAVAAWYINYCDLFSRSLDACWSTAADPQRNSFGAGPFEIANNQFRYLFETTYRSPFGQSFGTKRHILDLGYVTRGALQAASNPAVDLAFLHFPIPHPPLFYDRTTGRYDLGDTPLVGSTRLSAVRYLDALELVDRTIGQVRQALEAANLWDRTHLVISSDHAARNRQRIRPGADVRVPFIVRVAGTPGEMASATPFNTVLTSDLVLAMLRGEVRTTAHVGAFVEDRARREAIASASGRVASTGR